MNKIVILSCEKNITSLFKQYLYSMKSRMIESYFAIFRSEIDRMISKANEQMSVGLETACYIVDEYRNFMDWLVKNKHNEVIPRVFINDWSDMVMDIQVEIKLNG